MSLQMRIGIDWVGGEAGGTLDLGALADLLEVVAASGTVQAAADQLQLSYRSVWGKLDHAERQLGQQLMVKSKGHGSVLSAAGSELLASVHGLREKVSRAGEADLRAAQARLERLLQPASAPLSLYCSHDIALEDCVQRGLLDGWTIRTMGSGKALDALRAGKTDLAGFHGPDPAQDRSADDQAIAALAADADYFLLPLMRRELGFVVAKGNPLTIATAADLARPGVRLINRQPHSGTRAWLDRLLAEAGIAPAAIDGYRNEEFTHSAVVRAVAAGAADVGFAVRAASAGLAVDFIAVGTETYYVAGRAALRGDSRVAALAAAVHGRMLLHPGYDPAALPQPPA